MIPDKRMFDFEEFYRSVALRVPPVVRVAEVGVAEGASLLFLAQCLRDNGREFQITAIDSMAYGGFTQYGQLTANIHHSGLGEFIKVLPVGSLDASCYFPDGLFDFVFIDSSHTYEQTKAEIRLWWRKVKDGGLLAGHDYHTCEQVRRAVDEVIPKEAKRPPLADGRPFPAEPILETYPTEKGFGVWAVTKRFWMPTL